MHHELHELNLRRLDSEQRLRSVTHTAAITMQHAQNIVLQAKDTSQRSLRNPPRYGGSIAPTSTLLLRAEDGLAWWNFEHSHRAEFEGSPNERPEAFYTAAGFAHAMHTCLQEQANDVAYHYLVRSGSHVRGSMGLTQVHRAPTCHAQLHWRMAPQHRTQALQDHAVHTMVDCAFYTHRLEQVQASASANQLLDVQALVRSGFTPSDTAGGAVAAAAASPALAPVAQPAPTTCAGAAVQPPAPSALRFEIHLPPSMEDMLT